MSLTPYYQDDWVTLHNWDSLDAMPWMMNGRRFDLCLTDPPYNYGMDYGENVDDSLAPAEYEEFTRSWFRQARELSNALVVFPGNGNLDTWFRVRGPSAIGCGTNRVTVARPLSGSRSGSRGCSSLATRLSLAGRP